MFINQSFSDKFAIGLSAACAVHCLLLPLMAAFLPSILTLPFADESFHFWMVIFVIPVSAYALTMGCNKHKRYRVFALGLLGLALLVLAVALGEERISENQEKLITLLGSSLIAAGHFWNFCLCRRIDQCECTGERS